MRAEPPRSWSRAQRILHWSIAALIGLAAPLGLYMVGVPIRQLLLKFVLYQLHKTLGITVLLLTATQLILHGRRGRPAADASLEPWQQRSAQVVHAALFLLMIATPLLGYFTAATAPVRIPTLFLGFIRVPHIVGTSEAWFDVLRQVHLVLAVLLAALAGGHAVVALHHHWHGRNTLIRMWAGVPTSADCRNDRTRDR